jgi:hypothetical protein
MTSDDMELGTQKRKIFIDVCKSIRESVLAITLLQSLEPGRSRN